jgi:hypothetical protein
MKQIKYIMALYLLNGSMYPFTDNSFMTYRSQEFNIARNNSGYLKDYTAGNTDITIEYMRSFDKCGINNYFFGGQELIFSGSRVADRGMGDILADYFSLPTDFKSSVSFSPLVQNAIINFDSYWLLGCADCTFDLRVIIPFVHSRWSLNPCERVIEPGVLDYPAGYMDSTLIARDALNNGALETLSGGRTVGDIVLPPQYGRIACGTLTANKIADIFVAFGGNIPCTCLKALHIDLNVSIPTGTIPDGKYLFAPQVGNGRHWALGVGISTQYDFINDEDCCYQITGYFDAIVQHLFKSTQKRSYDFKYNGPGSRYMLLEPMLNNFVISEGFSPNPFEEPLVKQIYGTSLVYAIDLTTLNSKIKINAQADVDVKIAFKYRNFSWNLGYNGWVRSGETLSSRECFDKHQPYAIKGDAQVYGFIPVNPPFVIGIPVNATQSHATLYKPQGNGNTVDNFVNNNADNPAIIYNAGQIIIQTDFNSLVNTGITGVAQINGSNQAVLLSDCDIANCTGLSPRAFSNKIFGSLEYDFCVCDVEPYVLLGAEAEFAGKTNGLKTAISQWGVWIKGGVSY